MKQLLILSGKGGTGKTTVASAFIRLLRAKAYADCDVDAPNLHLLVEGFSEPRVSDYYGMDKAEINGSLCTECDLCRISCRFNAISYTHKYQVDYYSCEGCGVCEMVCSAKAISMKPAKAGELMLYKGDSVFSTAQLRMGYGNSGLLVTEVKNQLKDEVQDAGIAIIDGSPGIGCPVIASLSGVDMVLIVAEPSLSGISDMERIIKIARGFGVKIGVCINKYDINSHNTEKIEALCRKEGLPMVGKIPLDKEAVKAINRGHSIVDIDCAAGKAVKHIFRETMDILEERIS